MSNFYAYVHSSSAVAVLSSAGLRFCTREILFLSSIFCDAWKVLAPACSRPLGVHCIFEPTVRHVLEEGSAPHSMEWELGSSLRLPLLAHAFETNVPAIAKHIDKICQNRAKYAKIKSIQIESTNHNRQSRPKQKNSMIYWRRLLSLSLCRFCAPDITAAACAGRGRTSRRRTSPRC